MPELFSIETSVVRLTWAQRRQKPVAVPPEAPPAVPFGLVVTGHGKHKPAVQVDDGAMPCLFEQTDYTLFVRSRAGQHIAVRHTDPMLLRGVQQAEGSQVRHGVVNFGTQVGESRFVVLVDGQPHVSFQVEVIPSKLSYRADYDALHADLQAFARSLSVAYLRAAVQPAGQHEKPPSEVEWITLVHGIIDKLEQAARYLVQHPQWSTQPEPRLTRIERITHPDPLVQRALAEGRGKGAWQDVPDLGPVRRGVPARPATYTLDTPEHRWLAGALHTMQQRLSRLSEQAEATSSTRARYLAHTLTTLEQRVTALLRLSPLREVEPSPHVAPTLRLRTAPGYAEAYRLCLHLRRGLHIGGEAFELHLKDLHLLYEYWCFFTVLRLLAEAADTNVPWRDLVQVDHRGLHVRLRKGHHRRLRIDFGDSKHAVLIYNPRFSGRRYLVPQQPDFVLDVHRGTDVARYVLDAKYRLNASPAYQRRYGVPGPPADALNALHRYRDALRDQHGGIREAVALYPWRDEAARFPDSRHAQALRDMGIGAIPLLPGHTDYLRDWLWRVVG